MNGCIHRWKVSTYPVNGVFAGVCLGCGELKEFPLVEIKWDNIVPRKVDFQEYLDYEYERRVTKTTLEWY